MKELGGEGVGMFKECVGKEIFGEMECKGGVGEVEGIWCGGMGC